MARIESGRMEIDENYCRIEDVWKSLFAVFDEKARKKNISLKNIMESNQADFKAKDYSLYAYIITAKNEPNVSNYFESMRQFNDYASKVNDNLVKLAIIDVILLVASVAM